MVAILLAAVGVPLWLVVGLLIGAAHARRQFTRMPGVFRCKVRTRSGAVAGVKETWKRSPDYALWMRDVLLVQRGLALMRTLPIGVERVEGEPEPVEPTAVKGLGPAPRVAVLLIDGGATIELAAAEEDARALVGPMAGPPA